MTRADATRLRADDDMVSVHNADGAGNWVLVCDHASARVPPALGHLGLEPAQLLGHIGWDVGALALSQALSARLDAPVVAPTVSRLVLDVNRDPKHPGSIVERSDGVPIPGNAALDEAERSRRAHAIYHPYHRAIDALLAQRDAAGLLTGMLAIHSFTAVFGGRRRPWQVGILFDDDDALARRMIEHLRRDSTVTVGENQPYAPADGVYHTLERHARRRGLPCAMVEVRNDELRDEAGIAGWAARLAAALA